LHAKKKLINAPYKRIATLSATPAKMSETPELNIALKASEIPFLWSGTELHIGVRTDREMKNAKDWFKANATESAFAGQLWFFCRFYIRKPPVGTTYRNLDADALNSILTTMMDIMFLPVGKSFRTNTELRAALLKRLEAEIQPNPASKQMHEQIKTEFMLKSDLLKME
jgi:hypothetical protein